MIGRTAVHRGQPAIVADVRPDGSATLWIPRAGGGRRVVRAAPGQWNLLSVVRQEHASRAQAKNAEVQIGNSSNSRS